MNKKGFSDFGIILIVLIGLAAAGGVWYCEDHNLMPLQPVAVRTPAITQLSTTSEMAFSSPSAANLPPETSLKRYSDPDGYFRIDIPFLWEARQDGTGSSGSHKIETIALNSEDESDWMEIDVPEEGKPSCNNMPAQNSVNATLAGLPAQHDAIRGWWTLYTDSAIFQITYTYPGSAAIETGGFPDPMIPATVPPAVASSSQELVNTIMDSFLPTDPQRSSC